MGLPILEMKKNISFVASALLAAFPLAVAAQGLNNILRLAETAVEIVDIGILIVFTIAVLVFGWQAPLRAASVAGFAASV